MTRLPRFVGLAGRHFSNFAAVEQQAMQAVLDASSDKSLGPAIPAPLRCIHVTPAWNLTSFFTEAPSNSIPFDAICQSYYPMYHGPLTAAQAAASNPSNQPVEQTVLNNAASSIGAPIFLIEVGEHYENGFDANDPWYAPTVAGQRQFLIDVNSVLKGLPNHLGMGMDYWDAAGVNTASSGGGFTNGDGRTDGTYAWNGLTLFDNADNSGTSLSTAVNYSAILSGANALGGKLDATLAYALVNVGSEQVLGTAGSVSASGTPLGTAAGDGGASLSQQWSITSNGDGYLQIANINGSAGAAAQVLDNAGSSTVGSAVVTNSASAGDASQEWDLVTAGSGEYTLVNKASGLVLAASSSGAVQQQSPATTAADWIVASNDTQLWQIVPVHITEAASVQPTPTYSFSVSPSSVTLAAGTSSTLSLTVTPSGGYQGTVTLSCSSTLAGVSCSFNPTTLTLSSSATAVSGKITITAPASTAMLRPLHRPGRSASAYLTLCWLPAGILLLFTGAGRQRLLRGTRHSGLLLLLPLLTAALCFTACGSGGSGGNTVPSPQPVTGMLTNTAAGSTGGISQTAQIAVTVD